ncbi:ABC-2 type transport system permease protein [Motilibacter rhizosphaerae]|uniref:ABC-2 type transport system permease protein n=1 Tax=Motilibacter rhizosphaerae TaxID=598652 RepID=A0A4Q7NFX5_9ACTN|nr:ABC transporter permease [Motilibacter rhizosphaerae]RZS82705.1 ABC-2 type transport system permease protein [Motilibacter rhizosphaerae]
MSTTTLAPATSRVQQSRRTGTGAVLAVEVRKLTAQLRTRVTLLLALIAPAVVVVVLDGQQNPPKDTLYGRYIHQSGYAMPLLVLGFAAQWLFPLLTSIVAGDIFASEDQHGTWKTVLTRSVSRSAVFCGKTLAAAGFATLTLAVLAASTIVSSLVVVGTQPLEGLTGQLIPPHTALWLVVASWALMLAPLLGFTALAILLSVKTRNPAIGVAAPLVLGFCSQLVGSLGNVDLLRRVLLTTSFESWHGLLVQHRFYDLAVEGVLVSAAWTVVCLTAAYVSLRHRDITGG